jgi:long-chain acyl-CoA synthetase
LLFGQRFQHAVSGGAKLPIGVSEFFHALGATIYEGYGLTETCVATNVNLIGKNKIGSVGPAMDLVEVSIACDGEILFRGPNVTKGYYNRPEATRLAWDEDGWFHTGDLGRLDEDGFLFITGRKKDLIVTAGGKNVAPKPIEDKLAESPLVSQALVFGEGRPYCIALLSLDKKQAEAALQKFGISSTGPIQEEPHIHKILQEHVDRVNKNLSRHETIKKFQIVREEFTAEKGEVTPTFKVKRNVVYSHYRDIIDDTYES